MSDAEQRLAEKLRRPIKLCLAHSAEMRLDSEQLASEVEYSWQEWRAEAGVAADRLDGEWAAWHGQVQRKLGPPSS